MTKTFILLLIAFTFTFTACDVLQQVATTALEKGLTNEDIGGGLKEALTRATETGSS